MCSGQVFLQRELVLLKRVPLSMNDDEFVTEQPLLFQVFGHVPLKCNRHIDAARFELLRRIVAVKGFENNSGLRRIG